jgi:hypothetical protein
MKNYKITAVITCLFFIAGFSFIKNNSEDEEKIIGVKIYEYKGDYNLLFDKWKEVGINTVYASVALLSDDEFKSLAKKNNINTYVILPIFYSPEDLERDSSLFAITQYGKRAEKEWVKFVCPSDEQYRSNKINYISEFVKKHHPTGISMDFIRHFVFWEKVYPEEKFDSLPNTCFDKRCITKYLKYIETDLPADVKTEQEIYEWIKENNFNNWVEWKNKLITDMVRDIVTKVKGIDPNIKVNLHAVPWRQNDYEGAIRKVVGQDFKSLSKYVDYLSPMTYSHMVKRKPGWINSVVKDIREISGSKILPSIQVGTAYLADSLTVSEFEQCLTEALKEPSCGVVFWNWDALASEKGKCNLVKKRFKD